MKIKISILLIITGLLLSGCFKVNPDLNSESGIDSINKNIYNEDKIIIVIDEWPPFTSKELESYGVCTKIVIEAMKASGLECEFQFRPWARALDMVKYGDAWGTFPWIYKEERVKDFFYSDTVLSGSSKIFYKKNNSNMNVKMPDYNSIYDLKQFKFGGVYSYTYENDFQDPKNNFDYELYSSLELAFSALDKGYVDIINEDEVVGWYIISKLYPDRKDEFATLDRELNTSNLYMLVNKSNEESLDIMNKFNEGLKIIKKNGKYNEILDSLLK